MNSQRLVMYQRRGSSVQSVTLREVLAQPKVPFEWSSSRLTGAHRYLSAYIQDRFFLVGVIQVGPKFNALKFLYEDYYSAVYSGSVHSFYEEDFIQYLANPFMRQPVYLENRLPLEYLQNFAISRIWSEIGSTSLQIGSTNWPTLTNLSVSEESTKPDVQDSLQLKRAKKARWNVF